MTRMAAWLAIAAAGLAGGCCDAEQRELPGRVAELEQRVDELEVEVLALRTTEAELRTELDAAREQSASARDGARDDTGAATAGAGRSGRGGGERAIPSGARCTEVDGVFVAPAEVVADVAGAVETVRVIPHFTGGSPDGFKLHGIRADSLASSCGFRNGDVVTELQGSPLTSPDQALQGYAEANAAGEAVFTVERGGEVETVRLRVADEAP